jgi:pimeloyl-ACP methyl ester carboxylesterase
MEKMMSNVSGFGGLDVTLAEAGEGKVVLHGGGGPATVAPIAAHLSQTMHTITPTHPGWNGTVRPEWLTGVDDLAMLYLRLLKDRGYRDVTLVGSSIGGWIAAEIAVRDTAGLIGRVVIINGTGIEVAGAPIVDFFSLTPRGIAEHSYDDPDRFFVDPASLPAERVALQRGNIATLKLVAADMYDPKLKQRLALVDVPVLVLWGASDRIVTPVYGRAFAAALPKGRFELVERAGHLPQLEQPEATFAAIDAFVAA